MSTPATAKSVLPKVATTPPPGISKKPPPNRTRLFHFAFDLHPSPLNKTTWSHTRLIASDPSHPFYIRTQRRLAAFDPSKLHWAVKAPVDLSRKVIVRNWAVRRVKEAFKEELKVRGYGSDGAALDKGEGGGDGGVEVLQPLKGALSIYLDKDRAIITASGEEVKRECGSLVQRVQALQHEVGNWGRSRSGKVKARGKKR